MAVSSKAFNNVMEQHVLTQWGRDKMTAIFADDIFIGIFLNEKFCILNKISLKCVP